MGFDNKQYTPEARRDGLVVQQLDDEVLIYDRQRHKAHCLNQTAALIWNRCDGQTTIAALAQALSQRTGTPIEEEVVRMAVEQLARKHLLQAHAAGAPLVAGVSRREMLKRTGIAAAIALPVITSVVAPTAVQAATCISTGGACTTSAQCCSGLCNAGTCA